MLLNVQLILGSFYVHYVAIIVKSLVWYCVSVFFCIECGRCNLLPTFWSLLKILLIIHIFQLLNLLGTLPRTIIINEKIIQTKLLLIILRILLNNLLLNLILIIFLNLLLLIIICLNNRSRQVSAANLLILLHHIFNIILPFISL